MNKLTSTLILLGGFLVMLMPGLAQAQVYGGNAPFASYQPYTQYVNSAQYTGSGYNYPYDVIANQPNNLPTSRIVVNYGNSNANNTNSSACQASNAQAGTRPAGYYLNPQTGTYTWQPAQAPSDCQLGSTNSVTPGLTYGNAPIGASLGGAIPVINQTPYSYGYNSGYGGYNGYGYSGYGYGGYYPYNNTLSQIVQGVGLLRGMFGGYGGYGYGGCDYGCGGSYGGYAPTTGYGASYGGNYVPDTISGYNSGYYPNTYNSGHDTSMNTGSYRTVDPGVNESMYGSQIDNFDSMSASVGGGDYAPTVSADAGGADVSYLADDNGGGSF